MNVDTAITLINSLILKPGWQVWATDYTARHESAVCVEFKWHAPNYNRENAPNYQVQVDGDATAKFVLLAAEHDDAISVYREILRMIMVCEAHEWREAFRVDGTYWAPFHPHHIDGMKRYGDVQSDLSFGII